MSLNAHDAVSWQPAPAPIAQCLDVRVFRGEGPAVRRTAQRLFGRKLGLWEYAGLAGAPDDASVELGTLAGDLYIEITDAAGRLYYAVDRVRPTRGGPVLVIDALRIIPPQMRRKGLGLRMLARQLAYAERLGVRTIETRAGRSGDENGYYTWPRLGFDGPLPEEIRTGLPVEIRACRSLLDLFASEHGRLWWLQHGTTIDVSFDVSQQSISWQVFADYVRSSDRLGFLPQP